MRNSWLVWIFILVVIITVLVAFNYHFTFNGKARVSLNEIFPEDETMPVDVEYEFMDNEEHPASTKKEGVDVGMSIKAKETVRHEAASSSMSHIKNVAKKARTGVTNKSSTIARLGKFTIQVASFKTKSKAHDVLVEVQKKGYQAYLGTRDLGKKGIWYRVYIGRFSTKKEANNFLQNVRKDYSKAFVIAP